MKVPNLKHLHYLTVLHREKHFLRAAEKCNVSQSTLSSAIQNLEDSIGQQLLERDHKTFVFTDFGEELVEKSQALLHQTQDWMNFAHSSGDWQTGSLKLGVIPTIAPFLFESLIKEVKQNLPKIDLKLIEDTTENLLNQLADGQLDALILALPMKTTACKQLVLGGDPFHLIAHEENASGLSKQPNIDDLPENSVFLLQKEHCLTGHAVAACGLEHKEQISSLSANSLHTLVSLVNSKMGYTFLPSMALNSGILDGTDIVTLDCSNNAKREIGLVWRVGTTRMQLFRRLAQLVAPLLPLPNSI